MKDLDTFLAFIWAFKELLLIYLLALFLSLVAGVSVYKFIKSKRNKE